MNFRILRRHAAPRRQRGLDVPRMPALPAVFEARTGASDVRIDGHDLVLEALVRRTRNAEASGRRTGQHFHQSFRRTAQLTRPPRSRPTHGRLWTLPEVDAQNAPTAPWKTRTERGFPTSVHSHSLFRLEDEEHEDKNRYDEPVGYPGQWVGSLIKIFETLLNELSLSQERRRVRERPFC